MKPRPGALFAVALVVTVCFAAHGTWTTRAADPAPKKLSQEDFRQLQKLFQDARQHSNQQDYAASNKLYEDVLSRLPPQAGRYDSNRKHIFYSMAGNHALLGETDKALKTLERAVHAGYWNDKVLQFDNNFKSLRDDERYQKIVTEARVGLIKMAFGEKDIHGKTLNMEEYRDKVIVFDLWGTWCGPCRTEIPTLIQMQKKYGKDGLRIVGLTCERGKVTEKTREKVASFASRNNINYTLILLTQEQQRAVELRSVPTKVYVGRNFTPRERESGALPAYRLESKIVPLLKESATAGK